MMPLGCADASRIAKTAHRRATDLTKLMSIALSHFDNSNFLSSSDLSHLPTPTAVHVTESMPTADTQDYQTSNIIFQLQDGHEAYA